MTERDLIIACQNREASAERKLVELFAPMLLTVARRYVPDQPSAEDVLQESFIRVFRALPGLDPDRGTLEPWMRRIVINTALLRYRKKFRKHEVNGLEQIPDQEVSPEIYSRLGAEELMNLIGELPDIYRVVFNLYVIEGMDHAEIADLLGIAAASSRSRLQRARVMLQERIIHLETHCYEPRRI